jgi:hypothetical protein
MVPPFTAAKPFELFLPKGQQSVFIWNNSPFYAPDLNPDEGVWNWLKRVALKNQCFTDLISLERAVLRAKDDVRSRRDVLIGSIRHCGYSV